MVHKDYQGADQKDKQNHHFPSRKLFAGKSNFSDSESKRKYNLSLFKEVAPKYQYATIALSFGQDRHWKKLLIDQTPTEKQLVIVDIATGTGDIAQLLKKKYTQSLVLGVDQSIDMMHYQKNRNTQEKMYVSAQDMNVLALKKESVDLVTGGYALRNAPDISTTLDEIHRILKPGGKIILQVPWQWKVHEAPFDFFRYSPYALKYLLEKAGYSKIKIKPMGGFYTMKTLKFNYFTNTLIRGPRWVRAIKRIFFTPFWHIGQFLAPIMDKTDRNHSGETVGYFVTAEKKE